MTNAYLLISTRLDELHYAALTTMDAQNLIKLPISLNHYWKSLQNQNHQEEQLNALLNWLETNAKSNDFLVIEGDEQKIEPVLSLARKLELISMRPVWTPVPAFIPLIDER